MSALQEWAQARLVERACAPQLYRSKLRPKLFCATGEDCSLPGFLVTEHWSFERALQPWAVPPRFRAAREDLQKMTLSKQKEAVAATLSTVSQRAMEIVALPADQREARYKIYRQVYIESAMEHGLPRPKAHAWADQMNQWIRTLVKKIEQSGGAAGGTA